MAGLEDLTRLRALAAESAAKLTARERHTDKAAAAAAMAGAGVEDLTLLRALAAESAAQLTARERPDLMRPELRRKRACSHNGPSMAPPPPSQKAQRLADPANEQIPSYAVLQVPESCVGSIIGKGGQVVLQLEAETGATITVGKLRDEGGLRRICIEGSDEAQAIARMRIENLVATRVSLDSERMRCAQDMAMKEIRNKVSTMEHLDIPSRLVGFLIGRGGENVKSMEESFGVSMDFDKSTQATQAGMEVRGLTIKGPEVAVAAAKQQVEKTMLQCERRDGNFNASLEDKYGTMNCEQPFPSPALNPAFQVQGHLGHDDAAFAEQPPPPPPELHWSARCSELSRLAAQFARDPICVAYYMHLKASGPTRQTCAGA